MVDTQQLTQLVRELAESAQLIVLFGSVARGVDQAHSDVDVGVLAADGERLDLPGIEVELSRGLRCDVQVVDLRTAPPLLRFEIARDGVVLHARDEHAWPAFKARAMTDWWEWKPTAEMIERAMLSRAGEQ